MRRRRAARGAGSLVRDAPPGLGARAGPGRGATPWRGTVRAVVQQGAPVCQPAGSRFSSDFPVVQQGFPVCPPAGSRNSSDFPVSEWQDFVSQWCFPSRNLLCTGPKPSRNRQFFVLERYGDSVVSVIKQKHRTKNVNCFTTEI